MRAMLMRQPAAVADRPLRMEDVADPTPGPGEILVEVRACGICRTDLHVVEGELPVLRTPLVPGHQVVGRVAGRGPGATRFREGDRVGIAWLRHACGRCLYCATDRENLCERAEFTGWHADGGYADYAVVDEDYAYAIPSAFDDVQAAPFLHGTEAHPSFWQWSPPYDIEHRHVYALGPSMHVPPFRHGRDAHSSTSV